MANSDPTYKWKPGQSGNPKGRIKQDNSWAGILRRIGESQKIEVSLINEKGEEKKIVMKCKEDTNFKKVLCTLDYINAINGNTKSIDRIQERTEGKVPLDFRYDPGNIEAQHDLSKLTAEELKTYKEIVAKMTAEKVEITESKGLVEGNKKDKCK